MREDIFESNFRSLEKQMLVEEQIDELEEDLIDIEQMLESCPIGDTETIKELSKKKEIILKRLGRRIPLF